MKISGPSLFVWGLACEWSNICRSSESSTSHSGLKCITQCVFDLLWSIRDRVDNSVIISLSLEISIAWLWLRGTILLHIDLFQVKDFLSLIEIGLLLVPFLSGPDHPLAIFSHRDTVSVDTQDWLSFGWLVFCELLLKLIQFFILSTGFLLEFFHLKIKIFVCVICFRFSSSTRDIILSAEYV